VTSEERVSGQRGGSGAIRLRAVLVGLALIPLNARWLIEIEYVRYSDNATTAALFFNALAILLGALAINRALTRFAPRWAFTRQELLVVYIMVTAATVMAAHDQLQILLSTLAVVVGQATPGNLWEVEIHPHLPPHLVVLDRSVVDPLFWGGTSLYAAGHWRAWIGPLAWWTFLATALVWVMLCLVSLLRRQWDAERLNYPIAEVPLAVSSPGFLGQRLLWIGVALGAIPQAVNLLHSFWPAVPALTIGGRYLQPPLPWGQVYMLWIPIFLYPFAYGLAFLLPLHLMSSYLFFLALSRIELAISASYGYTEWGGFPFVMQQTTGACLGVALVVVWLARGHLRTVWRSIWGRLRLDDSEEPMPYRLAAIGLVLGTAALVWFAVSAGMRWQIAALYMGIFLAIVLTVARVRAELGLPTFELYRAGADQILTRVAGNRAFTSQEHTAMALLFWLTRTHRQFPVMSQADALHIGRRSRSPMRRLPLAIMLASVVGIISAFWAMLDVTYRLGYHSARFSTVPVFYFGMEPVLQLQGNLQIPQPTDWGTVGAYAFGAGFTILLAALRTRLLWWPLHPVGYLASGSIGVYRLWLPIFVTWVIKAALLRYGGLRAYRRALPFFLGLVVGEFSFAFLRTLLDLALGLYLPPGSGIGGL